MRILLGVGTHPPPPTSRTVLADSARGDLIKKLLPAWTTNPVAKEQFIIIMSSLDTDDAPTHIRYAVCQTARCTARFAADAWHLGATFAAGT